LGDGALAAVAPRQKVGSFGIDQAVKKLQQGGN